MNEAKATCCHRCGRVHVKGSKCPRPYLTGSKSCAKRANEGLEDPKDNPCWKGYHPVGTKIKDGREVPNCVPIDEVNIKTHFIDRAELRGVLQSVSIPKKAYKDYDKEKVNEALLDLLQRELNTRLTKFENLDLGISQGRTVGYIILLPKLVSDGTKYYVTMTSLKGSGYMYLAIVRNNTAITMYPTEVTKEEALKDQIRDHLKRKEIKDYQDVLIHIPTSSVLEIDIDELQTGTKKTTSKSDTISTDALPYKVKTDYRVGSTFVHDQYGTGKVVAAAGGGKGDAGGTVDWIEVDFKKPYVSGGKLIPTRKISNVFTSAYFGKTLKKENELEEESDDLYEGEFCNECLAEIIEEYWNKPIEEAEYRGRKVPLGKPMQGDVKKFKVYVKDPKTGRVRKINFGDPNMRIKKSNPKRRKSFRARHKCSTAKDRTTARYWSCRKW